MVMVKKKLDQNFERNPTLEIKGDRVSKLKDFDYFLISPGSERALVNILMSPNFLIRNGKVHV